MRRVDGKTICSLGAGECPEEDRTNDSRAERRLREVTTMNRPAAREDQGLDSSSGSTRGAGPPGRGAVHLMNTVTATGAALVAATYPRTSSSPRAP